MFPFEGIWKCFRLAEYENDTIVEDSYPLNSH